jgi:uncharacterized protein (DUF2336 family)
MQETILRRISDEAADARPERFGPLLRQLSDLYLASRGKIDEDLVDIFVELSGRLLAEASLFERMAFSNAIADIGVPPTRLVDHILRDVYLVARPMIERGPLSDTRLFSLLDNDKRELTQVMIAQRPSASVAVTDRLVAEGSMKVLLALAANTGAKLSEATFEKLGGIAGENRDMDAALAHRADLPVAIAKRLHRNVGRLAANRVATLMARDDAKRRNSLVLRG